MIIKDWDGLFLFFFKYFFLLEAKEVKTLTKLRPKENVEALEEEIINIKPKINNNKNVQKIIKF
jgi:hypothetical protein